MQQPVEYEWRTPYYTKYHKIGHQCEGKQMKQGNKKWIPKVDNTQQEVQEEIHITDATLRQHKSTNGQKAIQSPVGNQIIESQETKNSSEQTWTTVRKCRDNRRSNNSGKSPTKMLINCGNVFATLRDRSPLVFNDDLL